MTLSVGGSRHPFSSTLLKMPKISSIRLGFSHNIPKLHRLKDKALDKLKRWSWRCSTWIFLLSFIKWILHACQSRDTSLSWFLRAACRQWHLVTVTCRQAAADTDSEHNWWQEKWLQSFASIIHHTFTARCVQTRPFCVIGLKHRRRLHSQQPLSHVTMQRATVVEATASSSCHVLDLT